MKIIEHKFFAAAAMAFFTILTTNASASVCTTIHGLVMCADDAASLSRVTGIEQTQALELEAQNNNTQKYLKAKSDAEAAKRAARSAAQHAASGYATEAVKQAAAVKTAKQNQNDSIATQQLSAKTPALKTAAEKAAADLYASRLAALQTLSERQQLAAQVASQAISSGASCVGYWFDGRCVLNGQVAFSDGHPVNVMNQPTSSWSDGRKRQTCTLVYTYRNGVVVGSANSVCTFS
jgi:hypothetical protein